MADPEVTVLMSVYNGREYLAAAIESILAQTFADFEFLIINDGSTEPVEDIIKRYDDKRIVLLSQPNAGLTRTLNRGIGVAGGRFIARMDADDISSPLRLERQIERLRSNRSLDIVGSFFEVIGAQEQVVERKYLITEDLYRLWRLLFHNNYGHGTMMFRKAAVVDVGLYNSDLMYAQDYDLWSRMTTKSNTAIIPEFLYKYRLMEKSGQSSVKNYESQLATAIEISNRNLMKCNGQLDGALCAELRALYWNFQLEKPSIKCLELLPLTFKGFCIRFELNDREKKELGSRITADIESRKDGFTGIGADEVMESLQSLLRDFGLDSLQSGKNFDRLGTERKTLENY